jgi:hypothetical protein
MDPQEQGKTNDPQHNPPQAENPLPISSISDGTQSSEFIPDQPPAYPSPNTPWGSNSQSSQPIYPSASIPPQWGAHSQPTYPSIGVPQWNETQWSTPPQPTYPPTNPIWGPSQPDTNLQPKNPITIPPKFWLFSGIAVALIVSIIGSIVIIKNISVGSATITITPEIKTYQNLQLTLSVGLGQTNSDDIVGRSIIATSAAHTQSFPASTVHVPGTAAKGSLHFSNIQLTNPGTTLQSTTFTLTTPQGLTFTTDVFSFSQGSTFDVPTTADVVGKRGNIPAYTFNGLYEFWFQTDPSNIIAKANMYNTSFTGGTDVYDYDEIDDTAYNTALTQASDVAKQEATQILKSNLAKEKQSDELLSSANPYCSIQSSSDHKVGDKVAKFNLTTTATCNYVLFKQQLFDTVAKKKGAEYISSKYSAPYAAFGTFTSDIGNQDHELSSSLSTTIGVTIATSKWIYTSDDATKKQLAGVFAGQDADAAKKALMQKEGIKDISISLNGIGGRLPTDSGSIVINVKPQ